MTIYLLLIYITNLVWCQNNNMRIIHGQIADIKNHRYQAALYHSGKFLCGGGIIAPKHLLTAAHCFYDPITKKVCKDLNYSVLIGTGNLTPDGHLQVSGITLTNIFEYGNPTVLGDLAVVHLKEDVPKIVYHPLELPKEWPDTKVRSLKLAGWGCTENGREFSKQLLQADFQVIECPGVYNDKICGKSPQALACWGDSGSPAVSSGIVYGVVSTVDLKNSCIRFVNVYEYKMFISKAINSTVDGIQYTDDSLDIEV